MSEQPKWIERAKETYKFHRSKVISDDSWTIAKTAKALKRSSGSISEDVLIVRWLETHEKQLEKFPFAYEALEFIRKRRKELDFPRID
jgi:hypothetical protein